MRRQASMLVPLIEEGFIEGPEIDLFIKKYFSDFKDRVDALILGCTHYPLIKDNINNYLGGKIKLIDPAEEVAKEVYEIAKDFKGTSKTRYFLTDVNKRFLETAKMFLGEDILDKVAKVEI